MEIRFVITRWGRGMEELDESGQKVQSSSYKISKYWQCHVCDLTTTIQYTGKLLRVNPGLPWCSSGWESACWCRGHRFEPGLGWSHMLWGSWACVPQLLSQSSRSCELQPPSSHEATTEAWAPWARAPQWEATAVRSPLTSTREACTSSRTQGNQNKINLKKKKKKK